MHRLHAVWGLVALLSATVMLAGFVLPFVVTNAGSAMGYDIVAGLAQAIVGAAEHLEKVHRFAGDKATLAVGELILVATLLCLGMGLGALGAAWTLLKVPIFGRSAYSSVLGAFLLLLIGGLYAAGRMSGAPSEETRMILALVAKAGSTTGTAAGPGLAMFFGGLFPAVIATIGMSVLERRAHRVRRLSRRGADKDGEALATDSKAPLEEPAGPSPEPKSTTSGAERPLRLALIGVAAFGGLVALVIGVSAVGGSGSADVDSMTLVRAYETQRTSGTARVTSVQLGATMTDHGRISGVLARVTYQVIGSQPRPVGSCLGSAGALLPGRVVEAQCVFYFDGEPPRVVRVQGQDLPRDQKVASSTPAQRLDEPSEDDRSDYPEEHADIEEEERPPAPKPVSQPGTHEVFGAGDDAKKGKFLALRDLPGGKRAVELARMVDGTRMDVLSSQHGKTRKWLRVKVRSGPATGRVGYSHGKWIRRVTYAGSRPTGPLQSEEAVGDSRSDARAIALEQAAGKCGSSGAVHKVRMNCEAVESHGRRTEMYTCEVIFRCR